MSTKKGRQAEDAACLYLQKQNYTIIARNCRLGRGELDIVACKDDILAFVEVKGHQQRQASLLAMTNDKCQRLISAGQTWWGKYAAYQHLQCRFDLIVVTPRKVSFLPAHIEHILDVIRL
ncbi:MAG: YraN family protein [Mariprofundaceae bacterium]|nr:YraN family protein [Mariprofundaceae bacterium]